MVLVLFLLFAWFSISVLVGLPGKLPLSVHLLLFMAVEAVLTNKLTIVGFRLNLFSINTSSIPHYLALILHNDFTVTSVLLTFANVFLTATKPFVRWGVALYAFLFQLFLGAMLRWNGILVDKSWNYGLETAMIALIMIYTLLMGRLFQRMASREGWIR